LGRRTTTPGRLLAESYDGKNDSFNVCALLTLTVVTETFALRFGVAVISALPSGAVLTRRTLDFAYSYLLKNIYPLLIL
jgi:hypothetical protein